jgi:hypothetical protein
MSLSVDAAPKKRTRLTRAACQALDDALMGIAEQQQPMSVRGLYYQAEVRELVSKQEKDYGLVQRRCLRLRRRDVMPYEWITDNSRSVYRLRRYWSTNHFLMSVARLYRRNYWAMEDVRVEIWIEKEALRGVIYPTVVDEWGVDLYVQKGFSSASYLWAAAQSIKDDGRPTHIYVLSDFDPSGKCLLEKIGPGLRRHLGDDVEIHVHDLAVTPEQIEEWGLPTRPTKIKQNSHFRRFEETYGRRLARTSCELDAIPPNTLRSLVSDAIESRWSNKYELEQLKIEEQAEQELIKTRPLWCGCAGRADSRAPDIGLFRDHAR